MESSRGLLSYFSSTQMDLIESLFVTMGEPDPRGCIVNPLWATHWTDVQEAWDQAADRDQYCASLRKVPTLSPTLLSWEHSRKHSPCPCDDLIGCRTIFQGVQSRRQHGRAMMCLKASRIGRGVEGRRLGVQRRLEAIHVDCTCACRPTHKGLMTEPQGSGLPIFSEQISMHSMRGRELAN